MELWRDQLVYRRRRARLSVTDLAAELCLHKTCVEALERADIFPSGELREQWERAIENAEHRRRMERSK